MAGLLNKMLDLLKGRSYTEILLALLIAANVAGIYWMGGTVIPAQTKQIQDGYKEINRDNSERNTERMKYQEDSHRDTMKAATEAFRSASEQQSRRDELLMRALLEKREIDAKERE